jgi:hypothetical protein
MPTNRNYSLKGIPLGSPRRNQWQHAADLYGVQLSDFIRSSVDARVAVLSGSRGMAEEKLPVELETILKEEAKKYKLAEDKLREEVGKELYARVAREIVKEIYRRRVGVFSGAEADV